jgi:hypothetical protein
MKLLVKDVFRFSDGRVAFAVLPDQPSEHIGRGWYDLVIDGKTVSKLRIDGEDMVCRVESAGLRSVSTRDSEKLMEHSFRPGSWILTKGIE